MKQNHIEIIKSAERKLAAAHLTLDLNTIDQLLHSGYVILQPDGTLETKANVLESYRSGNRLWHTAVVDQLDVRLYDSTAIVIGRWQATGINNSQPFDYAARFISVWLYEEERWQNISYQSAEIQQK